MEIIIGMWPLKFDGMWLWNFLCIGRQTSVDCDVMHNPNTLVYFPIYWKDRDNSMWEVCCKLAVVYYFRPFKAIVTHFIDPFITYKFWLPEDHGNQAVSLQHACMIHSHLLTQLLCLICNTDHFTQDPSLLIFCSFLLITNFVTYLVMHCDTGLIALSSSLDIPIHPLNKDVQKLSFRHWAYFQHCVYSVVMVMAS